MIEPINPCFVSYQNKILSFANETYLEEHVRLGFPGEVRRDRIVVVASQLSWRVLTDLAREVAHSRDRYRSGSHSADARSDEPGPGGSPAARGGPLE
ncbi:hypothetical protein GCM10018953_49180 [Streptosporangium nondiastaticum]